MVCECHLISDPLYQHTWSCLQHYNFKEAIFTAERIFAENPNDESIYLLATCFYRGNGPKQAKNFILRQDVNSSKCRYLLAKCYMDIGNYAAAEITLLGVNQELESPNAVVAFYKDIASFVLQMLAEIFKQSERRKLAISYLRKCLELDPLSWSAFTDLVDCSDNVDPAEVFTLPKGVMLNNQSCLRALNNKINTGEIEHPFCPSKKRTDFHDSQEDLSVSRENVNPKNEEKFKDSVSSTGLIQLTEEQLSYSFNDSNPRVDIDPVSEMNSLDYNIIQSKIQNRQKIFVPRQYESTKPLFGNICVESSAAIYGVVPVFNIRTPESTEPVFSNNSNFPSPIIHQTDGYKKFRTTNSRVSFGTLNSTEFSTPIVPTRLTKTNAVNISTPTHIYRHNALNFSAISAVPISPVTIADHNHFTTSIDSDLHLSGYTNLKSKVPRTRSQAAKEAEAQRVVSHKEDEHGTEECNNVCDKLPSELPDIRLQSALHYLQLLVSIGRVYKCIKNFRISEAFANTGQMPAQHSHTALISSWIAKAYLEINDKEKAYATLALSYQNEPWQLHGLALFSSILWTLNKEKELIILANDMIDMDRDRPEVWCVFGNLMSLNKETETATRFFQRAIQINPNCAYGYLLLGHEYFAQDELDKALISFRRACELDSTSYHAGYCIAGVYQRQDNYSGAEKLLNEALKLFPDSLNVLINLAVVRSKLKQHFSPESVLELLDRACRLYPAEPRSRYQRATILYQNGRFKEALSDLQLISNDLKEARIFLLMSVICKQTGELTKAMLYNKWATDIDPKCTNDCFMLDHNFGGNVSQMGGDTINMSVDSSGSTGGSSFLVSSGHRVIESMHDDTVGTNTSNHISFELSDAE